MTLDTGHQEREPELLLCLLCLFLLLDLCSSPGHCENICWLQEVLVGTGNDCAESVLLFSFPPMLLFILHRMNRIPPTHMTDAHGPRKPEDEASLLRRPESLAVNTPGEVGRA